MDNSKYNFEAKLLYLGMQIKADNWFCLQCIQWPSTGLQCNFFQEV